MAKPTAILRLYEAYRAGFGIRLSAEEVREICHNDDAILTRITNEAAGVDIGVADLQVRPGGISVSALYHKYKSWREEKHPQFD